MSPKKKSKKYVKIVFQPIENKPKYEAGSSSPIPEKPPARETARGSRIKKMPTVITQNWSTSVSVMDHIPPTTE